MTEGVRSSQEASGAKKIRESTLRCFKIERQQETELEDWD